MSKSTPASAVCRVDRANRCRFRTASMWLVLLAGPCLIFWIHGSEWSGLKAAAGSPAASLSADSFSGEETPALMAGIRESRRTLERTIALLRTGLHRLEQVHSYTCTATKQEQRDGKLSDRETMQMKFRHAPYSVYLKWFAGDVGREVLYVDGEHNGKMLVRLGGIKGRLLPLLRIDPESSLAGPQSITKVGLLEFTHTVVSRLTTTLERTEGVSCRLERDQIFDGRHCFRLTVVYQSPEVSPTVRVSIVDIDAEFMVPIRARSYTWPDRSDRVAGGRIDESTLLADYSFTDLDFAQKLSDADFDPTNSQYALERRRSTNRDASR